MCLHELVQKDREGVTAGDGVVSDGGEFFGGGEQLGLDLSAEDGEALDFFFVFGGFAFRFDAGGVFGFETLGEIGDVAAEAFLAKS